MRPIDADYLIKRLNACDTLKGIGLEPVMAIRDVKALISVMPTVRGTGTAYWVHETDRINHWHCSNCNQVWGTAHRMMNYCPNCGALMAGEKDDTTGV